MGEIPPDIGIGKLPEQREFKGYNFISEILIPLAQAGLAGAAQAGLWGLKWLWPMILAAFTLALVADAAGLASKWIWGTALSPVIVWLGVAGKVALSEFFGLLYGRMSSEAKSWTAGRPGEPAETREVIRYRIVFVNGRRAEAEDMTPPMEEVTESVIDPHLQDLAGFVAVAATIGLSKSSWCSPDEERMTLPSGLEVSQPKWAAFLEELAFKYQFVRKRGGAYVWAVEPQEAVAFLKALAEGRTGQLPPYPAALVG